MKIERAQPRQVIQVAKAMRERDVAEFLAVSPATNRTELVGMLASRYANCRDMLCASRNGVPVGVGAMIEGRPNVATLLFFATDDFPRIAVELTSFIRHRLFPQYKAAGVHRIECLSIDGYDDAHRWIQMLGLDREAVLPGYGKDGEAFHQFAWVAEHVRPARH